MNRDNALKYEIMMDHDSFVSLYVSIFVAIRPFSRSFYL